MARQGGALIAELKRARQLLAENGWVGPAIEPSCVDSAGRRCLEDDEGVRRFSVMGALIEARAWPEGWRLLEQVVAPAWSVVREYIAPRPLTLEAVREFRRICVDASKEPTLEEWLAAEGRKDGEILRAFVLAIQRGKKGRSA